MTTCNTCGKTFTTELLWNRHRGRKTPCKLVAPSAQEPVLTDTGIQVPSPTIDTAAYTELAAYYNTVLNQDKSTYQSSNDEPTPIACIEEMMAKVPEELWNRPELKIIDVCCGNGNFFVPVYNRLLQHKEKQDILENVLEFNDINQKRLDNVRTIWCADKYRLQIKADDFLNTVFDDTQKYDMVCANPPYAKMLENGKRASKNHNLIKDFIEASLAILKPGGYLVFITPDNWMSYADRNTLISRLTSLQIVHLDIHSAKKHFKKIGSSFTWYVIQNVPASTDITVSGVWKKTPYCGQVRHGVRNFIPLYYTQCVQDILDKTVGSASPKFGVETSSDLHRYTKRDLIRDEPSAEFQYRLIHTPSTTVYASRPHKFQEGYKVFISTTDRYNVFVDVCGMTQSIVFIRCQDETHARRVAGYLEHPLYRFINNICRWGNFNNIRVLQSLPLPSGDDVYECFGITAEERAIIETMG